MKRHIYLLVFGMLFSAGAFAAVGDTTIVQAHDTVHLSYYGNYDTAISLPNTGKTYRKIYMEFTLGKYKCAGYDPSNPGDQPGQTGWCGDWDYTVQNYLMTPAGDTLELGRLITPYANTNAPRTPWTWKQRYYYDVTDYYPVLKNAATLRILYAGYSGGFTASVRFIFIEGTPERNVLGVKKLWGGSFNYGDSISINTHFPAVSLTAPAGTATAALKFTVTGHGSDANSCCEFLSKNYSVLLNGSTVDTKAVWRATCGSNELYPQSGTWPLNRGNWCPGALVYSNFHMLPGITAGSVFNVGLAFENYTNSHTSFPSYITQGTLFYYGDFNHVLDASLDDIISPSNYEGHFRENPYCGGPVIHVHNSGSAVIATMDIQYGVAGYSNSTYTWRGAIRPLHDTDITLPEPLGLRGGTTTQTFTATILTVNGATDNDNSNNQMTTGFMPSPVFPSSFIIAMRTNALTDTLNASYSDASWQILDANTNAVVKQRTHCSINTTYTDTVNLSSACYKLEIITNNGYGLNWWAYPSAGSGSISLNKLGATYLHYPLNGNPPNGTYANDFGNGIVQYFTVGGPLGVTNVNGSDMTMETFPNPAQNDVMIRISGMNMVNGTLQVIDALGKTVLEQSCTTSMQKLNVTSFPNGMYSILFTDSKDANSKLHARLLIAK
ncbi:MAG: T9SS type A sorting domain-containing protein [Taibaiella sp.]|nr:T9SS type A sorting domain-containing protein [Taibaiella sp.]